MTINLAVLIQAAAHPKPPLDARRQKLAVMTPVFVVQGLNTKSVVEKTHNIARENYS